MYTISMRPYCPDGTPDKCINFEQERASWALSTFSRGDAVMSNLAVAGLAFYSPLEKIDISVTQLAALVAGLDSAYEELCNALYEDAPKDLAKTPWRDLQTFMACIPRGMYTSAPDLPGSVYIKDVRPVPFLYSEGRNLCLAWTGATWGTIDPPVDVSTYDSAGTCFGWNVLYKEDSMSAECVRDPEELSDMLVILLESLSWLNTEAKVYVHNIYSVQ